MPQGRPYCLGITPLKAPRGLPTNSAHPGGLQRQANVNGAGGNHRHNGGNCWGQRGQEGWIP